MDIEHPPLSLLMKLGSIAVHIEEAMSKKAHVFDVVAMQSLLGDSEVKEWLELMDQKGFLPKKR
jgi:hypothetical protein